MITDRKLEVVDVIRNGEETEYILEGSFRYSPDPWPLWSIALIIAVFLVPALLIRFAA